MSIGKVAKVYRPHGQLSAFGEGQIMIIVLVSFVGDWSCCKVAPCGNNREQALLSILKRVAVHGGTFSTLAMAVIRYVYGLGLFSE